MLPSVNEFKDHFDSGEFAYGEQPPLVRDKDIERAQEEAKAIFAYNLFEEKESANAFNLLTAHFLLSNLNAIKNGGAASFVASSQSADGLSISYLIPSHIQNSPTLSQFATTSYGIRYAMLVYPRALANARGIVSGATTP